MEKTYLTKVEELERLAEDIQKFGVQHGLDPSTLYNVNLCIDEIFTNIIYYAFDDNQSHEVTISINCEGSNIIACITDKGKAFNPLTETITPDITAPLEDREEGGLGVYFLKQLMDTVEYRRDNDTNILTMRKTLPQHIKK